MWFPGNEFEFVGVAQILYMLAALIYATVCVSNNRNLRVAALILTAFAFIAHTAALTLRIQSTGRVPFANLYETLLFCTWILTIFSVDTEHRYKIPALGAFTLPVVFISLAAMELISNEVKPLIPALNSNWLMLHVITWMLGYAACGIAFATSVIYLLHKIYIRLRGLPKDTFSVRLQYLDTLTYRIIGTAFPLLTIGMASGSVWADVTWGTYWSWDPKDASSLAMWLIYAICLHLRYSEKLRGTWSAIASIMGFLSIIYTYFAINYFVANLQDKL